MATTYGRSTLIVSAVPKREGCSCEGCENPGCHNGGCQGRKPAAQRASSADTVTTQRDPEAGRSPRAGDGLTSRAPAPRLQPGDRHSEVRHVRGDVLSGDDEGGWASERKSK